jgi:hypothetical protein
MTLINLLLAHIFLLPELHTLSKLDEIGNIHMEKNVSKNYDPKKEFFGTNELLFDQLLFPRVSSHVS